MSRDTAFTCHNCAILLSRVDDATVVKCPDCGWVHMFTTDSVPPNNTLAVKRNKIEITNFDRERGWLWYNNTKHRIPNGCTHIYFAVMPQEKVNDHT